MFDGGEVCRGMIGSDPAFVVAENHVHDPMQTVLDRPVTSYDRSKKVRQHDQRGDVSCVSFSITPLVSRMLSTIATAFSRGQPWRFRSQSTL